MNRQTPEDRLRPWMPDKVINSETHLAMMELPEDPLLRYGGKFLHKLIFVRNLSRRVLQKCCTVEGANDAK